MGFFVLLIPRFWGLLIGVDNHTGKFLTNSYLYKFDSYKARMTKYLPCVRIHHSYRSYALYLSTPISNPQIWGSAEQKSLWRSIRPFSRRHQTKTEKSGLGTRLQLSSITILVKNNNCIFERKTLRLGKPAITCWAKSWQP